MAVLAVCASLAYRPAVTFRSCVSNWTAFAAGAGFTSRASLADRASFAGNALGTDFALKPDRADFALNPALALNAGKPVAAIAAHSAFRAAVTDGSRLTARAKLSERSSEALWPDGAYVAGQALLPARTNLAGIAFDADWTLNAWQSVTTIARCALLQSHEPAGNCSDGIPHSDQTIDRLLALGRWTACKVCDRAVRHGPVPYSGFAEPHRGCSARLRLPVAPPPMRSGRPAAPDPWQ